MAEKNDNYKKITEFLKLDKPLVIFDLETTGLSLNMDRVIELAYLKIEPNGRIMKDDIFLNPETKISDESTAIHGLTNEQLADKPFFRDKAGELWEIFGDCYYGGFNAVNFDLPMLKREFLRVGRDFSYTSDDVIDSKQIYHFMEPRTLSAAYKFYCGKKHADAHNALADVEATAEVLLQQLEKYEEARSLDFIRKMNKADSERWVDNDRKFYWRDGEAYFAFSKHKDEPLARVAETDPGFLQWILSADFSEETKNIVSRALEGEFPKK